MKYSLGLELGSTRIKANLIDEKFLIKKRKMKTSEELELEQI